MHVIIRGITLRYNVVNIIPRYVKSIRDIWKWIKFLNASVPGAIDTGMAYVHGALLVYIDGIGSGKASKCATTIKKCTCCSIF